MHWLSYSNSDQSHLRDPQLDACWDALLVPGTLAAYYFQGTGGFVLSRHRPYAIDPRTPLLQELALPRPAPRASHIALATIHDPDAAGIWPEREITIDHWQDGRWHEVVDRVLTFQSQYSDLAGAKVSKYAALLAEARNERVKDMALQNPFRYVPPYWAVSGSKDPWWALSLDAIGQSVERKGGASLHPILCLREAPEISTFSDLIQCLSAEIQRVFLWKSQWDETKATQRDIDQWVYVIRSAAAHGIEVLNLYGGYLSVLMTALGLAGFNHGVGYSEKRDARRLGETGAPPARYYVPALHQFLPVPTAQAVVSYLPVQWLCDCQGCDGAMPASMSPDRLKVHFLLCRAAELARVLENPGAELDYVRDVAWWLRSNPMPSLKLADHAGTLQTWASAISYHL